MNHACGHGMSERRACRLVKQPRGTQRYQPTRRDDEDALTRATIATVAGLERYGISNAAAVIAMLSLAMGMTNPALTKIGAKSMSITLVTGTLNRVGGHLAAVASREPLPEPQDPGDSHLARARIDASVWSGFLVGAGLFGMAGSHFRIWALLPPCVVMIALGLFSKAPTSKAKRK